jgi:hypothetical protein
MLLLLKLLDMVTEEKLHARHFSAVRNFRAPPFAVVA